MDIVEYAERICGIPLKEYQKDLLRAYCNSDMFKEKEMVYRNLLRNMSMSNYIYRGSRNRCFFCEYDTGPYKDTPTECKNCVDFNNFKRKKRMAPRQAYEYERYIQRVGELRETKDLQRDI